MTCDFKALPPEIQQSIKGILDYLLMDSREAEDFLESGADSHVWISITNLENFAYEQDNTPEQFAKAFTSAEGEPPC